MDTPDLRDEVKSLTWMESLFGKTNFLVNKGCTSFIDVYFFLYPETVRLRKLFKVMLGHRLSKVCSFRFTFGGLPGSFTTKFLLSYLTSYLEFL